jgi:hyperosmotically inducible protein
MLYKKMLAVAAAAACVGLGACENTAQGIKEDAKENSAAAQQQAAETKADTADERAAAKDAASDAGAALKEAGKDVADAAEKAGDKIADAAHDAGKTAGPTVDAAQQTAQIKSALTADSTIDASHIDVDTDAATKTVTLKGHVPSAAQKTAAGRVAQAKASGYKVRNNLTVG